MILQEKIVCMKNKEKFFLVGCGKMGLPILESILKIYSEEQIAVVSREPKKLKKKLAQLSQNIEFIQVEQTIVESKDSIILAVPPQKASDTLQKIKLDAEALLISVMAGYSFESIQKIHPRITIIRAMPNLPITIGKGLTIYCQTPEVKRKQKEKFLKIFENLGACLEVNNEDELNICTAISGSGTGFVFYLLRSFYDSAVKLGLSDVLAKEIICNGFINSTFFANQSKKGLNELIDEVCTKGGTTEAGIQVLERENIDKIIKNCLLSAYEKSKFLAKD